MLSKFAFDFNLRSYNQLATTASGSGTRPPVELDRPWMETGGGKQLSCVRQSRLLVARECLRDIERRKSATE
jgi:hypothetical protein